MGRPALPAVAVLAALLALAGAVGAQDAQSWLGRIGPALSTLNYAGTMVYVSDGRMETLQIFHGNADGRERERLVTLSGARREIVRDGNRLICIGTAAIPVLIGPADAANRAVAADVLSASSPIGSVFATAGTGRSSYYNGRLAGSERVAGLDTQIVELQSGDELRFGYRLWLERRTGLPLRIALIDADGDTLEQLAFTQIQLGQRPSEADLAPSNPGAAQQIAVADARSQRQAVAWVVVDPPRGFSLRASRRTAQGAQLFYSDGIASVSVYVEPATRPLAGEYGSRSGATFGHMLRQGDNRIFAVGKVPALTVARFARGVRPTPAIDPPSTVPNG